MALALPSRQPVQDRRPAVWPKPSLTVGLHMGGRRPGRARACVGVLVSSGVPDAPPSLPFICERCGYALGGLEPDGVCPECGQAIAESDPARRVGSPWQRRASDAGAAGGVGAWLRTLSHVALKPGVMFRALRVSATVGGAQGAGVRGLTTINLGLCAVAQTLAWSVSREGGAGAYWFGYLVVVWAALWGATRVEDMGIRFIGARRGWRLAPGVARSVVGHATFGWLLGGMLSLALAGVQRFDYDLKGRWWSEGLWYALSGGAWLLGLLAFEGLVYVGARRCRYANTPRALSPAPAPLGPVGPSGPE